MISVLEHMLPSVNSFIFKIQKSGSIEVPSLVSECNRVLTKVLKGLKSIFPFVRP